MFLNKYINGLNCDILYNTLEKRIFEFSKNLDIGVVLNNLKISKLIECNTALNKVFDSIQDEKIGDYFSSNKTELKEDIDSKEESVNYDLLIQFRIYFFFLICYHQYKSL